MPPAAAMLGQILARPIAHRGLHGCGDGGPVENTIGAAEAAIGAGYGIECDVRLSRDGEAFVFHDDDLGRLTGTPGLMRDSDVAEIGNLRLRDGSRIPTLTAFLAAVGGRTPLVVEIKSAEEGDLRIAETVLAAIQDYGGPLALESFDAAVMARCGSARCPVGLVGPAPHGGIDPRDLPRCDFVSWQFEQLAEATSAWPDLARTTWTVRRPSQVAEATALGAQIVFEGFRP